MASVFGIFLVRQYALSLPDELLEAARIDGASEARIFWSWSCCCVAADPGDAGDLRRSSATWNDFMWPLIVLTDAEAAHVAGRAGRRCRASTCRTTS